MMLPAALATTILLAAPTAVPAAEPAPDEAAEADAPETDGLATGWRIAAAQGAGLGGAVLGLGGLAVTGAATDFVAPFIGLTVAGAGALVGGVFAHAYALLAPPRGTGAPVRVAPALVAELGHRYVYDPIFAYRHFAVVGLDWRTGPWRVSPSGWFALDDDNRRLRLVGAYRIFGPRADGGAPAADGSFLELELGVQHHRYGTEWFSMTTGELALAGRLDLHHLAGDLRGSFFELSFGQALGAYHYDGLATEPSELLLARFAFGIYLGHDPAGWGELAVYYDHRHDGFTGGAKLPGLGSGAPGHAGIRARTAIEGPWGVALDFAAGSAYVGGVSVLYRLGGSR